MTPTPKIGDRVNIMWYVNRPGTVVAIIPSTGEGYEGVRYTDGERHSGQSFKTAGLEGGQDESATVVVITGDDGHAYASTTWSLILPPKHRFAIYHKAVVDAVDLDEAKRMANNDPGPISSVDELGLV